MKVDDLAVHFEKDVTLYGEEAVRVLGGVVTPNLFALLDTQPAIGRDFRADDGAEIGFQSVVILSDGLWRNRFGGDPSFVGEQATSFQTTSSPSPNGPFRAGSVGPKIPTAGTPQAEAR